MKDVFFTNLFPTYYFKAQLILKIKALKKSGPLFIKYPD